MDRRVLPVVVSCPGDFLVEIGCRCGVSGPSTTTPLAAVFMEALLAVCCGFLDIALSMVVET